MKATILDGCIGCGLCEGTCPAVFQIGEDGLAHVTGAIAPESEDCAREAAESCPVNVITVA